MFKILPLLALTLAVCQGASIGSANDVTTEKKEIIPLLKFENDKNPDGSFHFMFEGGDNSFREESGVVDNAGTDDEALEVSGSYRYIDADGNTVEVHYTAGKNGFVPVGTNILPEISALAKAAADLPQQTEEEKEKEKEKEQNQRKARSRDVEKEEQVVKVEVVEEKKPVKVTEKKPIKEAEKKSIVKKTEEKKVEEKKTEEKKPEEKKVEEKPAAAEPAKPAEKPTVEKKEEAKPAADKKEAVKDEKKVEKPTAEKTAETKPKA